MFMFQLTSEEKKIPAFAIKLENYIFVAAVEQGSHLVTFC